MNAPTLLFLLQHLVDEVLHNVINLVSFVLRAGVLLLICHVQLLIGQVPAPEFFFSFFFRDLGQCFSQPGGRTSSNVVFL